MLKISCIIAAYNESKRILPILDVVCNNPKINEVIVVNDGSLDNTHSLLIRDKRINFISYPINKGKTYAVILGIKASKNDNIMLLDADLLGLKPENIDDLILPIISKKADISISLRSNSLWIYKKIGMDFISGERVFNKNILGDIDFLSKSLMGYGLETFMDIIIVKNKLKIKVVSWPNVSHARKQGKIGYWRGMFAEWIMVFHIFKTANIFKLIKLNKKMLNLRVLD